MAPKDDKTTEMSEKAKAVMAARKAAALAKAQQVTAARRSSGIAVTGRGSTVRPITDRELREMRLATKRKNMTAVEEEIYAAYTDPATGVPPMDVKGDWEACTISW